MQALLTPDKAVVRTAASGVDWSTCHWFALYTRSRHEKIAEEELRRKGLETFLPLRTVTRHWSDRKKIITEPLFPGYFFVRAALKDRWDILGARGIVRFVGASAARPALVQEKDLAAIRKFMDEGIRMDPFPYLHEGARVYVRAGAFKGTEGFIVRKDAHCRLVISIQSLLKSVAIEIDQACVEPI